MIKSYLIAGFTIDFSMEHDEYFQNILAPYRTTAADKPDLYFEIEKTDLPPVLPRTVSKRTIGENKYYCRSDGHDTIFYFDTKLNKIIALISFSEDYSKVSIKALNIKIPEISSKYFIFNLVGYAMHYIMQMKCGFVLHSSAISCNNQGIAFSARSGTGKTTHTSLWLKYIENCQILNDDTPIIKISPSNEVSICGSPWAGTSGRNKNLSIPLKALVFIRRGVYNEIRRLAPKESVAPFFDGITPPVSPSMLTNCLVNMDRILNLVPCYLLSCNMEPEAAQTAYNAIFRN